MSARMFQFGFYAAEQVRKAISWLPIEKLRQWWHGDRESPTTLTTAELMDLCVEAHGFPPYFGPQSVGDNFYSATQVPVVRVAPAENTTSTVWILQLDSHASQLACVRRRLEVDDEEEISLHYPQENLIPPPGASTWTSFPPSELQKQSVSDLRRSTQAASAVRKSERSFETMRGRGQRSREDTIREDLRNSRLQASSSANTAKRPEAVHRVEEASKPANGSNAEDDPPREEDLRTVEVLVGKNMHPMAIYQNYFGSDRSGGGDIENIEMDKEKGIVRITFVSPQVAKNVSHRRHTVAKRPLQIKLYVPKPSYPDKLLFENVVDTASRESLQYFLENVTGTDDFEFLYGEQPGTVLVTFKDKPDFAAIKEKCQKETLEGKCVTVSRVPISNCVLVGNLGPDTTKDSVRHYFLNKRSNGGEVEDVQLEKGRDSCRCYVYFKNNCVVDRVLAQKHVIGKRQLEVQLYMECLGPSGGTPDPRVFDLPAPLVLPCTDRHRVAFIAQSSPAWGDLCQQLEPLHAQPSIADNTLTLVCTIQPRTPHGRALARSWRDDVQQVVRTFFRQIDVHRVDLKDFLQTNVQQALAGKKTSDQDTVLLRELYEENSLVVVGMKSAATQLHQQISRFVKDLEAEIDRKKREITDSRHLKLFQLRLLQAAYFPEMVQEKVPGVIVTIDTKQNTVSFRGQRAEVEQAQLHMDGLLASAYSCRVSGLSETQKMLLEKAETQTFIIENIRSQNIPAVLERGSQEEVWIHTLKEEDAEVAIVITRSSVGDFAFDLTLEARKLLQTPGWHALKRDLEGRHRGKLLVTTSSNGQRIALTTTTDVVQGVVEDVQRFLDENTIYTETVRFSQNHQKFISLFRRRELDIINEKLKAYRVNMSLVESGSEINVCGTSEGIGRAKEDLRALIRTILCHEETVTDLAKLQFLATEKGAGELDMCGRSNQCVIAVHRNPAEQDGMMVVIGNSNIRTSVELPNGVTLAAVLGDITQMRTDAIVNAANDKMEHGGGLAKAIVDIGGRSIQEECRRLVRERGGAIPTGQVLVSGPGALPCKAIIHAVGPVYQGGIKGEHECLGTTIVNCLEEANRLEYTSIALPAISTGIFRYPADTATRVIVEAVKKYFEVPRRSSVRTVYLLHNDDKLLLHFCRAILGGFLSAGGWFQRTKIREPPPLADSSNFFRNSQACRSGPQSKQTLGSSPVTAGKGFTVVTGNIAEQQVDVIVNSTQSDLNLSAGGVSGSLLAAAGSALQGECDNMYPDGIGCGDVARTGGAALLCKEVFHIVLSSWSLSASQQLLAQIITKCLTEASESGYTSVAFPVLGTGQLQYPHDTAARTMLDTIRQYRQNAPFSRLQDIRIVIYPTDQSSIQAFEQVLGQSIGTVSRTIGPVRSGRRFDSPLSEPGLVGLSPWLQQVPESRSTDSVPSSMTLYIYAGSMEDVTKCLRAFDKHVRGRFTQQTITDKTLQNTEQHEVKRILEIGQRHGVQVRVNVQSGSVELYGLESKVPGAVSAINALLRSALLANLVQWYFIEIEETGTKQVPYDRKENQIIEEAYQNGQNTAEIVDSDGIVYVIDFDSMKESVKNDPTAPLVDVIRKDKMKGGDGGDLPEFWTHMEKDELVRLVPLQTSDPEYEKVEANFRRTLKGRHLTVTAVERVQNPTLYLQYQAKKAQMTRQNAGMENEKILWHGTESSSRDNINHYGFNRSYCGKHAVAYGQGVYFAIWSHYSTETIYSAPDANGNRYIYQCKVLVGHSVRGDSNMRVLPPRQGKIVYDSATNDYKQPAMYIIFNDTQAYPEYLITFK